MRHLCILLFLLLAGHAHAQPWQPQVIWQRNGSGDSSRYGYSILPLGDQNGDGYADWAIFALGTWGSSLNDSGRVEFFHGGSPPDTVPYLVIAAPAGRQTFLIDASAESI
jgi:hypothetical protein